MIETFKRKLKKLFPCLKIRKNLTQTAVGQRQIDTLLKEYNEKYKEPTPKYERIEPPLAKGNKLDDIFNDVILNRLELELDLSSDPYVMGHRIR